MDADLQKILGLPIYFLYLFIILGGGILAVISKSLIRALFGLVSVIFGVAGMYLIMAAPFMAFMQILIYIGAIAVLIFFAIMLTKNSVGEAGEEELFSLNRRTLFAIIMGLIPLLFLGGIIFFKVPSHIISLKKEVSINRLGEYLAGPYVLAFELISVVLLISMVGAVLLGFERKKNR